MARSGPVLLAVVILAGGGAGCVQTRIVGDKPWDGLRSAAGSGRSGQSDGERPSLNRGPTRWAVRLARFSGPKRQRRAHDLMRRLTTKAGLTGLWLADAAGTTSLYRGQFTERDSTQAQNALKQVRQLVLDNGRRFDRAALVAVNRQDKQIEDRHNLRAYSGYYTLQVGYYDEGWSGDRRKAAERNAKALRQQTDQPVYYYHGRRRSMVTVGLFGESEAFTMRPDPISPGRAKVRAYSQKIRKLSERFPHNYANQSGLAKRFKNDQAGDETQASSLVQVP
jgi:hypothetical protein